jgi:hypothetical protein
MNAFTKQTAYGHQVLKGRGVQGIALYPNFVTPKTYATGGVLDMTADMLIGGVILRDCGGAARADLVPVAANLIAAMGPAPRVGQSFMFTIVNTSDAAETITVTVQTDDTSTTLAGVMTIAQSNQESFICTMTSATTVTITRIT